MPVGTGAGGRRWYGREIILATLSLFGLLAILVLFGLWMARDRDRLEAAALGRAHEQALMLSEQAARLLEGAEIALVVVVQDAEPLDWNQVQASRRLWRRISREAGRLPYVDAYWLFDADGRLRLTSLAFPAPPLDDSRLPFFAALRNGAAGVAVSRRLGRDGQATFRLSRRLDTASGAFAGAASVTVDADYFHRLYRALPLPPGSTVAMLRASDLAVLVRTAIPGAPAPSTLFDAHALRRALGPNAQTATYKSGGYLMAVRAVPGFPLYVRVAVPTDSLRGELAVRDAAKLVTACLAVAALGLLTWAAFQQARRQRAFSAELAARVTERTQALETANAQLETLIQELHHRVNNNLQIIESLLAMQAARIREPEAKAALAPSIGRVHAIGLVHRTLYGSGELAELHFGDYLVLLARHLSDVYGKPAVDVEVSGANPVFGIETAVPLALIVHEILANVISHAYPQGGGSASISITEEPGHWCVVISDRGVGLPAGFDWSRLDWSRGHGLGLAIVRSLAAQLGGEVEVTTGAGTRFTLRVPRRAATPGGTPPRNA